MIDKNPVEDSLSDFQKHMNKQWKEKDNKERLRFWLPWVVSLLTLAVASYSLYLQKLSLRKEPHTTQQSAKEQKSLPSRYLKTDTIKKK